MVDEKKDLTSLMARTFLGGILLINSYISSALWPDNTIVPHIFALASTFLVATPLIIRAFANAFAGRLFINELAALAILAAVSTGEFRVAAIIAFFIQLSIAIEKKTASGAVVSLEALIKMAPKKVTALDAKGKEVERDVVLLKPGDIIRVKPGDIIPVDGVIVKGESSINEATITGESLPADKEKDDPVYAATINVSGAIDIRVERLGDETTVGKVKELIQKAQETRLPIARLIDAYTVYYTPAIVMIAFISWFFSRDINRVISILVISCPSALIVATPSALVAALSAASRIGILIKNIADLEIAAKLKAFIFDKTGTLTKGELTVAHLSPVENIQPKELLSLAYSVEKNSKHPVARAVAALAKRTQVPAVEIENFSETAGQGVSGKLADGSIIRAGRIDWLKTHGIQHQFNDKNRQEFQRYSVIVIAKDKELLGWIGLEDSVREEAASMVQELKTMGITSLSMITGDGPDVAARVADQIGIDTVKAQCLPQDKVTFVESIKKKSLLLCVVGDGVNDAPALASGDISIAMGAAGSDVALHSASIALMNNDLRRIPFLMSLSKKTRVVIFQNMAFGALLILGGLFFSSTGVLSAAVAAPLQNAATIVVIFNSARLFRGSDDISSHG